MKKNKYSYKFIFSSPNFYIYIYIYIPYIYIILKFMIQIFICKHVKNNKKSLLLYNKVVKKTNVVSKFILNICISAKLVFYLFRKNLYNFFVAFFFLFI